MPIEKLDQFTIQATVSSTSLADVGDSDDVVLFGAGYQHVLSIGVSNSGQALSDFAIQFLPHPDADWEPLISGTDWATATSSLPVVASGLNTLASGSHDGVVVNLFSAHACKFQASVASSSTTLTIRCSVGRVGRS